MRVLDLGTHKVGQELLFLFKGAPTSGKTEALLGFPRPIWIADLDKKVEVLAKNRTPEELKGITAVQFDSNEFEKFREELKKAINNPIYKTRVIDSLTSCADMVIRYAISQRKEPTKVGVIEKADMADYGTEADGLMELIRYLRDHVSGYRILTAHVTPVEIKDPYTQKVISTTWQLLTGGSKIARRIPGFFREIYHFDVRKTVSGGAKYTVTTKNDGEHFANTVLPLPTEIDWTNKKLFELLQAECAKKGITLS